jgi:predicted kinase
MKAYITKGLPGCGKSTWAREMQSVDPTIVIINNDTIRNSHMQLLGITQWSKKVEKFVNEQRTAHVIMYSETGTDIILDNTHMNPYALDEIVKLCKKCGYEVIIKDFTHDVSIETCIERDSKRTGKAKVGEDVIWNMHNKSMNNKPHSENRKVSRIKIDVNLPNCVLCDLDGTWFEAVNRGPYDESKVYDDIVRKHVSMTVVSLCAISNATLIFMSGRTEGCRSETVRCLQDKSNIDQIAPEYQLFMREIGDRRRDGVIKTELYNKHVNDKYNVLAVFDDRAQVIREAWKPLGLPVFRCGEIDEDDF